MKIISLYCLLFACLLSSCNRGIYVTIDNKKYDYGKNTVIRLFNLQGTPPVNMFDIKSFKKSAGDSSFFIFSASRANLPITVGDYSFPNNERINFYTSVISFYDNYGNKYMSGGDEMYGSVFVISSLNKKRTKGWFKGRLADIKADTTKPNNTITVEGRFNVSLKNVRNY